MRSLSAARLEEMIEQATVDCYNDSEQACGLFTLLDQALAVPFKTTVLGVPVTVTALDLAVGDRIVALIRRNGERQRIPLLDLPLPDPPPAGAEWAAAYRHWAIRSGRA
ncbi:MAG TPA: hypothetical protein VGQ26_09645 [Streptosporangiaceae bacterium]|jgi:hypothetical protein|nr:hypothetical protein [Streptosporangiaceae bacterium]